MVWILGFFSAPSILGVTSWVLYAGLMSLILVPLMFLVGAAMNAISAVPPGFTVVLMVVAPAAWMITGSIWHAQFAELFATGAVLSVWGAGAIYAARPGLRKLTLGAFVAIGGQLVLIVLV
eukprot:gene16987-39811_t